MTFLKKTMAQKIDILDLIEKSCYDVFADIIISIKPLNLISLYFVNKNNQKLLNDKRIIILLNQKYINKKFRYLNFLFIDFIEFYNIQLTAVSGISVNLLKVSRISHNNHMRYVIKLSALIEYFINNLLLLSFKEAISDEKITPMVTKNLMEQIIFSQRLFPYYKSFNSIQMSKCKKSFNNEIDIILLKLFPKYKISNEAKSLLNEVIINLTNDIVTRKESDVVEIFKIIFEDNQKSHHYSIINFITRVENRYRHDKYNLRY